MSNYSKYKEEISEDLQSCLETMACQPIIFCGSGMSQRYFNAPNWSNLLKQLSDENPRSKDFAYYRQVHGDKYPEIGTTLCDDYREWAWNEGKNNFDPELFSEYHNSDIFLKTQIAKILKGSTPKKLKEISPKELRSEMKSLISVRPHSIITTNYDKFLELLFNDYSPIIGEELLSSNYSSIGEIFKIHGCVSDPKSIVINKNDYDIFTTKKKYLTAKLLTYFLEHPVIIMGYSATDPNVQAILSDIDEILASKNKLVNNIYLVTYQPEIDPDENFAKEKLIRLEGGKSIRVKNIVANKYEWIFNSLVNENAVERVNPKLLRALLARTYELVRKDIPSRKIDIDYDILEHALSIDGEIKSIFGITRVSESTGVNIQYPFSLTRVAKELGYDYWSHADVLIKKIKEDKGVDIKTSDNKYHIKIPTGTTSFSRKYSLPLVDLLEKVKNGEEYNVEV
ncbi:SIR2 family protein [Spongiimicrobium sp. 2-473A-2-J]|uniref:SIR2 family protein n=1 Tax=Eudoraea algarum TaxID=3417568 RepID=UPI003D360C93